MNTIPKPPDLPAASRGRDYGRSADAILLDLAYAIGEYRRHGTPILDVLTAQARGRWR